MLAFATCERRVASPSPFLLADRHFYCSFVLVNEAGQRTFAKFHIRCDGGVTCLTSEAAQALAGADPDFLR